jgi:hypothetical protein
MDMSLERFAEVLQIRRETAPGHYALTALLKRLHEYDDFLAFGHMMRRKYDAIYAR